MSAMDELLDELRRAAGNLEYSPYDEVYIAHYNTTRSRIEDLFTEQEKEIERLRGELAKQRASSKQASPPESP